MKKIFLSILLILALLLTACQTNDGNKPESTGGDAPADGTTDSTENTTIPDEGGEEETTDNDLNPSYPMPLECKTFEEYLEVAENAPADFVRYEYISYLGDFVAAEFHRTGSPYAGVTYILSTDGTDGQDFIFYITIWNHAETTNDVSYEPLFSDQKDLSDMIFLDPQWLAWGYSRTGVYYCHFKYANLYYEYTNNIQLAMIGWDFDRYYIRMDFFEDENTCEFTQDHRPSEDTYLRRFLQFETLEEAAAKMNYTFLCLIRGMEPPQNESTASTEATN